MRREEALAGPADERPVLVVDLDDTVVDGGFWSSMCLLIDPWYVSTPPFAGAPESLSSLARKWRVVFLTARDDIVDDTTLEWLDHHGFPTAPVVFSTSIIVSHDAKLAYKRAALEALARRGALVAVGVGDKASDVEAYRALGARVVAIVDTLEDPDLVPCLRALGVDELGAGAATPRGLELLTSDRERAWTRIAARLARAASEDLRPPAPGRD